ncbi:50S ribosomal protein L11 methyltransferase [Simiduia aestuariiviva]|uniref:Ribosomal protein L11 methyltransferase n=1 Tax=Simiduia aestuariiviva TaxID=1510459 RepID=A0A839UGX4_9GAMM|nr:50S ribosomal protein L11 methyltransferase [Simiduia aestuariiviva]MBB3167294.1 ribosomal protein L11 methyltransferase [Simiduia aestuariiviva]
MPWLQLIIHTDRRHADAIDDALLEVGAVSVTLQDDADQPILEPALGETPLWDATRITGLFDADIDTAAVSLELLAQLPEPPTDLKWEQLEDKDWEREWMASFKPICCGERLWICPSWQAPPQADAVNLMLDPGLAFGTGTHPTTFLCLQWLDQQALEQKHLVDFGCGSGILGIAALLLGARQVIGVDIDPQALLATRDNATRNGLPTDAMPVYLPADAPTPQADIVLANILAGPLVELAEVLSAQVVAGGKLCLSGILATQAETVMAAYPAFAFDPVAQKEEWVRLTATKVR